MTTCLHSYNTHVLGNQKHGKAHADKIICIVLNTNCSGSNIIMVRTVTTDKEFWVLMAAGLATVPRRWKYLNSNGRCAQTNRHSTIVNASK